MMTYMGSELGQARQLDMVVLQISRKLVHIKQNDFKLKKSSNYRRA